TARPTTSFSWSATSFVASLEIPNPWSRPTNASPESFRSTRRYTGTPGAPSSTARLAVSTVAAPPGPLPCSLTPGSGLLAQLVADEPADDHVLAHLRGDLLHQVVDALGPLPDVGLVQEHGLLVEGVEHAVHDLVQHVLRLAHLAGALGVDLPLALDDVLGDLVPGDPARRLGRDLHGDLKGELVDLLRPRDEVGLAVDLDQDADAALAMDVGLDDAVAGDATLALLHTGEPTLTEDLLRAIEVAAGLLERLLALHHPG